MNPEADAIERPGPPDDPYFYGWRVVLHWDDDGSHHWEKVPLTAWDVLHPEEDDFVVQTPAHDYDCHYLRDALEDALRGRPGVEVFTDLRVDWQVPGLGAHGPDVIAFEGLKAPWDRDRGTLPVKDAGARPLLVVEVTSPNTRDLDLNDKVTDYHRAGVPVYVVVNRQEVKGRPFVTVFGYRHTPDGYVRLPEQRGGVWVESAGVLIRPLGDRVTCIDRTGNRIADRPELVQQRDALHLRVTTAEAERDAERRRAEAERERANAEQAQAAAARAERDAEKARADEAARKLAELEAELRRLRGETDPTNPNS
jgi:colicin import membrane protein